MLIVCVEKVMQFLDLFLPRVDVFPIREEQIEFSPLERGGVEANFCERFDGGHPTGCQIHRGIVYFGELPQRKYTEAGHQKQDHSESQPQLLANIQIPEPTHRFPSIEIIL